MAHRIGRAALFVTVLFAAGCGKQPTVDPPFSDLRLAGFGGKVEQVSMKDYVIERAADMAAVLSTPDSWSPPPDMPARTADDDMTRTEQEQHFGRAGELLASRMVMPSFDGKQMHAEALITVSRQAPGLRSVQCAMTLWGIGGGEHKSSCGSGEWRYLSPGISQREMKSDFSVTTWEEQFDAQGRTTMFDHKVVNKPVSSGKPHRDFSEHRVAQAYDADGRVTTSHGSRNGEDRYSYMSYLDPDRHGNPQRVMVLSSTSADRHDVASIKRVELLVITYSYYDEIR